MSDLSRDKWPRRRFLRQLTGQQGRVRGEHGLHSNRPVQRSEKAFLDLKIFPAGPWERWVLPEPEASYLEVSLLGH